jgi:hypothetical protein
MDRQRLRTQCLAHDKAGVHVHHQVIRLDLAAHQSLAQAECGVDHHFRALAGQGIGGKQHARGLALDHSLHHHRQRHAVLRDAVARPIGDGARGPQAAPAPHHRIEQRLVAHDVEKRVLLAGEAEVGEVFGGGGGADGDGQAVRRKA